MKGPGIDQLAWLEREKKRTKQADLRLLKTRDAVALLTLARRRQMPESFINELESLVQAAAQYEWGKDTVTDDFSVTGSIIVRRGARVDTLPTESTTEEKGEVA